MKCCGRVRAVHRDDIHAREHLVEAVPISRLQQFLDARADRFAVVIMDLQAKGFCAAGNRLTDTPHADDAQPFAGESAAHHPGRRPAVKAARIHDLRTFEQAARH